MEAADSTALARFGGGVALGRSVAAAAEAMRAGHANPTPAIPCNTAMIAYPHTRMSVFTSM